MRVLVAPDSFKGSLTSVMAAECIGEGIRAAIPDAEIELVPMADGGDGTVRAIVAATDSELITREVTGPLGQKVSAEFAYLPGEQTAVIEMAAASGLLLVPEGQFDLCRASTYGTGELIRHALDLGCRHMVIGIGGSATNDAGAGMARALGVRFLDEAGRELPRGGLALQRLSQIDMSCLDPRLKACKIEVACDVNNPLYGPRGAAAVYGPQKGATPEMVAQLDQAMQQFASVTQAQLGVDVSAMPGAGAAGGLGAGLVTFTGATLRSGVEIVAHLVKLPDRIRRADLVITGEGRLDAQSAQGKAVQGIAALAKPLGVPVVALVGSFDVQIFKYPIDGLEAVFSILNVPSTLQEAMTHSAENLKLTATQVMRLYLAGRREGRRT